MPLFQSTDKTEITDIQEFKNILETSARKHYTCVEDYYTTWKYLQYNLKNKYVTSHIIFNQIIDIVKNPVWTDNAGNNIVNFIEKYIDIAYSNLTEKVKLNDLTDLDIAAGLGFKSMFFDLILQGNDPLAMKLINEKLIFNISDSANFQFSEDAYKIMKQSKVYDIGDESNYTRLDFLSDCKFQDINVIISGIIKSQHINSLQFAAIILDAYQREDILKVLDTKSQFLNKILYLESPLEDVMKIIPNLSFGDISLLHQTIHSIIYRPDIEEKLSSIIQRANSAVSSGTDEILELDLASLSLNEQSGTTDTLGEAYNPKDEI